MSVQVELFEFTNGETTWRYAMSDVDMVHGGHTFVAQQIRRPEIETNGDIEREDISITVPFINRVGLMHMRGAVEKITSLTIYRIRGAEAAKVIWKGRVVSAQASGIRIQIKCESVLTSTRRAGLHQYYMRNCPYALYGLGCTLDAEDWVTDAAEVTALNGSIITVPGASIEPDAWYFGGMIRFDGIYRLVIGHQGGNLTLMREVPGLVVGSEVYLYPGCDHTPEKCHETFGNIDNYGGYPWIPEKNPMGGSSIV